MHAGPVRGFCIPACFAPAHGKCRSAFAQRDHFGPLTRSLDKTFAIGAANGKGRPDPQADNNADAAPDPLPTDTGAPPLDPPTALDHSGKARMSGGQTKAAQEYSTL